MHCAFPSQGRLTAGGTKDILRRQSLRPLQISSRNSRALGCCCSAEAATRLRDSLRELDSCLEKDNPQSEVKALQLVRNLKESGAIKAFGGGHQVPKRAYTLEELRLNKIEPIKFLSPEDKTLNRVRTILQAAAVVGVVSFSAALHLDSSQILQTVVLGLLLLTADQVANGGGFEALVIDAAGRFIDKNYARRVAVHEAGHFLVAYLIGLLPKKYILSSVDAFKRYGALNIQAGTLFCDQDFQKEVSTGKVKSGSLDTYCCIALAGVATEYLLFGQAEGGLNDVQQLDAFLKALQFSQAKADAQVRWAVLNAVELLRRHKATLSQLADAMAEGSSVGECIAVIEKSYVPL